MRYRQRYADLIANAEVRDIFVIRSRDRQRASAIPRRPRVHRGRDADAAAALRRRGGAAVHDPPQRARSDLLPAHRRRALSQAADRRRVRAGLRDLQGLPQRGHGPQSLARVHDARVLRGVRRLRDDDGTVEAMIVYVAAGGARRDHASPTRATRSTSPPTPGRASRCERRSATRSGIDYVDYPEQASLLAAARAAGRRHRDRHGLAADRR